MNMRRFAALLCAVLLTVLAGCSQSAKTIPLTDKEKDILAQMGDDVVAVSDEDWAETVTELQYHCDAFTGQVYQLEGIFRASQEINGVEAPYVYRTLVNGGEKTETGLPLAYLTKELPDGAWVRVSAIINGGEYGGETLTTLEVVAVETLAKAGQAELTWSGSAHNHS